MSESMSSSGNWADQFYQQNLPDDRPLPPRWTLSGSMFSDGVSDTTAVTTTITSPTAMPSQLGLSQEGGRVSRPARRRSRASRRTPTTLLNTDPSNFRAMVQQFTGGPSTLSGSSSQVNGASFGFGFRQQSHGSSHVSVAGVAGYPLQYQVQQQPYSHMYSFVNRHGNPATGNASMEASAEGFLMESNGVSPLQVTKAPSSSSDENRSNNFLF